MHFFPIQNDDKFNPIFFRVVAERSRQDKATATTVITHADLCCLRYRTWETALNQNTV